MLAELEKQSTPSISRTSETKPKKIITTPVAPVRPAIQEQKKRSLEINNEDESKEDQDGNDEKKRKRKRKRPSTSSVDPSLTLAPSVVSSPKPDNHPRENRGKESKERGNDDRKGKADMNIIKSLQNTKMINIKRVNEELERDLKRKR